jgi:hypothetical protein
MGRSRQTQQPLPAAMVSTGITSGTLGAKEWALRRYDARLIMGEREFCINAHNERNAMRMSIETLNGAYYRQRALECHRLAGTAQAAKPLFMRLYVLAQAYDERAKVVGSERTAASQNH